MQHGGGNRPPGEGSQQDDVKLEARPQVGEGTWLTCIRRRTLILWIGSVRQGDAQVNIKANVAPQLDVGNAQAAAAAVDDGDDI